jgi:hypothetical protein
MPIVNKKNAGTELIKPTTGLRTLNAGRVANKNPSASELKPSNVLAVITMSNDRRAAERNRGPIGTPFLSSAAFANVSHKRAYHAASAVSGRNT